MEIHGTLLATLLSIRKRARQKLGGKRKQALLEMQHLRTDQLSKIALLKLHTQGVWCRSQRQAPH